MRNKTTEIALQFEIEGTIESIAPMGTGLINDTYKVTTSPGAPDYVLQRINNAIFTDVDLLQSNIVAVTDHIRAKYEAAGTADIDRKVLRFVKLKGSDKTYFEDDGTFWRVSVFIPDAYTYDSVNSEYSYYAGKAFGNFEAMLSDIKENLGETIPDFHNMELRSRQLKQAIKEDKAGRMADPEVRALVEEIAVYDEEMCKAERMYREGLLPKRICHCDTKVNNMLFDKDGNVLCVIDLDTVMPSFVFSDFGDFLRTAGNTLAEDDPDTDKVEFRMDIFKAFAKGYIESAKAFLTKTETDNLPYGAMLFPYMQAVRFLTDYIAGDTYYKIKYPDHNLVRTRNQMALFKAIMSHRDEMSAYIDSLISASN
ncbi:MAG: aminoglycoside phosphotransferase family protein [Bacteroidales bacterium]|nr:aminoglycoside phosphotransferase family protein [Bacteroidales bacterium]